MKQNPGDELERLRQVTKTCFGLNRFWDKGVWGSHKLRLYNYAGLYADLQTLAAQIQDSGIGVVSVVPTYEVTESEFTARLEGEDVQICMGPKDNRVPLTQNQLDTVLMLAQQIEQDPLPEWPRDRMPGNYDDLDREMQAVLRHRDQTPHIYSM